MNIFLPQLKPTHRFTDQDKNLCPRVGKIQKAMAAHHLPALHRDLLKGFPPPTTHFYSAPHIGGIFVITFSSSLLADE